jgi:hypothetical protein
MVPLSTMKNLTRASHTTTLHEVRKSHLLGPARGRIRPAHEERREGCGESWGGSCGEGWEEESTGDVGSLASRRLTASGSSGRHSSRILGDEMG